MVNSWGSKCLMVEFVFPQKISRLLADKNVFCFGYWWYHGVISSRTIILLNEWLVWATVLPSGRQSLHVPLYISHGITGAESCFGYISRGSSHRGNSIFLFIAKNCKSIGTSETKTNIASFIQIHIPVLLLKWLSFTCYDASEIPHSHQFYSTQTFKSFRFDCFLYVFFIVFQLKQFPIMTSPTFIHS